jgi:hypothetical protein
MNNLMDSLKIVGSTLWQRHLLQQVYSEGVNCDRKVV